MRYTFSHEQTIEIFEEAGKEAAAVVAKRPARGEQTLQRSGAEFRCDGRQRKAGP